MTHLENEDPSAHEYYARLRRAQIDDVFARLEVKMPEYGKERRAMRELTKRLSKQKQE